MQTALPSAFFSSIKHAHVIQSQTGKSALFATMSTAAVDIDDAITAPNGDMFAHLAGAVDEWCGSMTNNDGDVPPWAGRTGIDATPHHGILIISPAWHPVH